MAADVTLQIRINGGGLQQGAVAAAVGNTCQLTALSKDGWAGAGVTWEIYSYPPAFTVPAGWTAAPNGTYYVLGSADPPSFVMDEWGKYLTRVTAANQSPDERTIVDIPSANGLRDLMRREGAQCGGERLQWTGPHQANLRIIDTGLSTAGSASVDPDPDTVLLRGPAGEGKVTSLETPEIISTSGDLAIGDAATNTEIIGLSTVRSDVLQITNIATTEGVAIDYPASVVRVTTNDTVSIVAGSFGVDSAANIVLDVGSPGIIHEQLNGATKRSTTVANALVVNLASGVSQDLQSNGTSRIKVDGTGIGFFAATPAAKPTVTGSRGGNAALASLLTALATLGLITDSTTA